MAFDEITDHVDKAKARLIQQYKQKPRIEGMVEAFTQEKQNLETVAKDLNEKRTLDNSIGVQLDGIGSIVGEARRSGESDTAYRVRIKARIGINISNGEPERMIETFQVLTGASFVFFSDLAYGSVALSSSVTYATQSEVDEIIAIMESVAPAGVRVDYIGIFDTDLSDTFAFAGILPGKGFSSTVAPTTGGKFATLVLRDGEFAFGSTAGTETVAEGFGTTEDPLVGGRLIN